MKELAIDSVVVSAPHLVSAALDNDDIVLLHVQTGRYYGLNPSGADIWKLVQTPIAVHKVVGTIAETFDVDASRCKADVLSLLRDMADKKLILVDGDATA